MSYMSLSGYAFVNADSIVVQVIGGELNKQQLAQFESDYRVLFAAEFSVPIMENVIAWIGGKYNPDTGEFSPPPQPKPLPESTGDTALEALGVNP